MGLGPPGAYLPFCEPAMNAQSMPPSTYARSGVRTHTPTHLQSGSGWASHTSTCDIAPVYVGQIQSYGHPHHPSGSGQGSQPITHRTAVPYEVNTGQIQPRGQPSGGYLKWPGANLVLGIPHCKTFPSTSRD